MAVEEKLIRTEYSEDHGEILYRLCHERYHCKSAYRMSATD